MKIRIVSDLHVEYSYMANIQLQNQIPRNRTEAEQVLVLAGDVCQFNKMHLLEEFLEYQSKIFKAIVYISGNHEYYGGNLSDDAKVKEMCGKYANIHYLNRDIVTIDGVNFIGTTLWSDHSVANYIQRATTSMYMNDFKLIRQGSGLFTIDHATKEFKKNVEFINKSLMKHVGEINVVLTHHAPSALSIHDRFKGDSINHGFYSDLEYLMHKYSPKLWIHGHMHNAFDYMVGDTRVICNPRGYPSTSSAIAHGVDAFENLEYDPDLAIML